MKRMLVLLAGIAGLVGCTIQPMQLGDGTFSFEIGVDKDTAISYTALALKQAGLSTSMLGAGITTPTGSLSPRLAPALSPRTQRSVRLLANEVPECRVASEPSCDENKCVLVENFNDCGEDYKGTITRTFEGSFSSYKVTVVFANYAEKVSSDPEHFTFNGKAILSGTVGADSATLTLSQNGTTKAWMGDKYTAIDVSSTFTLTALNGNTTVNGTQNGTFVESKKVATLSFADLIFEQTCQMGPTNGKVTFAMGEKQAVTSFDGCGQAALDIDGESVNLETAEIVNAFMPPSIYGDNGRIVDGPDRAFFQYWAVKDGNVQEEIQIFHYEEYGLVMGRNRLNDADGDGMLSEGDTQTEWGGKLTISADKLRVEWLFECERPWLELPQQWGDCPGRDEAPDPNTIIAVDEVAYTITEEQLVIEWADKTLTYGHDEPPYLEPTPGNPPDTAVKGRWSVGSSGLYGESEHQFWQNIEIWDGYEDRLTFWMHTVWDLDNDNVLTSSDIMVEKNGIVAFDDNGDIVLYSWETCTQHFDDVARRWANDHDCVYNDTGELEGPFAYSVGEGELVLGGLTYLDADGQPEGGLKPPPHPMEGDWYRTYTNGSGKPVTENLYVGQDEWGYVNVEEIRFIDLDNSGTRTAGDYLQRRQGGLRIEDNGDVTLDFYNLSNYELKADQYDPEDLWWEQINNTTATAVGPFTSLVTNGGSTLLLTSDTDPRSYTTTVPELLTVKATGGWETREPVEGGSIEHRWDLYEQSCGGYWDDVNSVWVDVWCTYVTYQKKQRDQSDLEVYRYSASGTAETAIAFDVPATVWWTEIFEETPDGDGIPQRADILTPQEPAQEDSLTISYGNSREADIAGRTYRRWWDPSVYINH